MREYDVAFLANYRSTPINLPLIVVILHFLLRVPGALQKLHTRR